jgi:hypothetical protein
MEEKKELFLSISTASINLLFFGIALPVYLCLACHCRSYFGRFLLFAMQGQIFRQQWCWKYENHIAFDYVEHWAFVQDFFARTKIPVFINRFGSGSKFGTIFLLIMVFTLMILKYFHFT